MEAGDIALVDGLGAVLILQVDEVLPPNLEDPDTKAMRDSLEQQLQSSIAQDLYRAFADDTRTRAGAEIDQQAINAIHANFR